MAVLTLDAPTSTPEAHRSRIRVALAAGLLALGVAAVAAADAAAPDQRVLEVSTPAGTGTGAAPAPAAAAPPDPSTAVASWLEAHRDDLFAGAPDTYLGSCADPTPADAPGLCSAMTEDLGDTQVHVVGVHASDAGADVLVEQTDDGWQVAAVSPWPALGERYDGAPWSPSTAITSWWAEDERAATMYGQSAVHLPHCDLADDAAAAQQPLLCSTLVEDAGATRVYDTGLVGRPADVQVTVTEQADRTWVVSEALAR